MNTGQNQQRPQLPELNTFHVVAVTDNGDEEVVIEAHKVALGESGELVFMQFERLDDEYGWSVTASFAAGEWRRVKRGPVLNGNTDGLRLIVQ